MCYLEHKVIFSQDLEALVINIYFLESLSKSNGKFGGLSNFKSYFWNWNLISALFKRQSHFYPKLGSFSDQYLLSGII